MAGIIQILIVAGEHGVAKGLNLLLSSEPDFEVVGEADTPGNAVESASLIQPDIALVDIDSINPLAWADLCAIQKACPRTSVILLSLQTGMLTECGGELEPSVTIVDKSQPVETLLIAIRGVCARKRTVNSGCLPV